MGVVYNAKISTFLSALDPMHIPNWSQAYSYTLQLASHSHNSPLLDSIRSSYMRSSAFH